MGAYLRLRSWRYAIVVLLAVCVSSCRFGPLGNDPKPAHPVQSPALRGLYFHRDYFVAFEFLAGHRVNMWHRLGPDEPLKGSSLGIVSYSEHGTQLVVTHSCGQDHFTKFNDTLYLDSERMLFRMK